MTLTNVTVLIQKTATYADNDLRFAEGAHGQNHYAVVGSDGRTKTV